MTFQIESREAHVLIDSPPVDAKVGASFPVMGMRRSQLWGKSCRANTVSKMQPAASTMAVGIMDIRPDVEAIAG